MMDVLRITLDHDGSLFTLYDDRLRRVMEAIGPIEEFKRVSRLEPNPDGTWRIEWQDWMLALAGGRQLPTGPYLTRGAAADDETRIAHELLGVTTTPKEATR